MKCEETQKHIEETFNDIIKGIGRRRFTIGQVVDFVQKARGKEIVFAERLIHQGYLGLCLSFQDKDLIVTIPNLRRFGKRLYNLTILHELIHIYRGDAEEHQYNFSDIQSDFENLPPPQIHKDASLDQEHPYEEIAEDTAALLLEYLLDLPDTARRLYGYGE